jgi:short subunit dehydrogenase-like uncharacterized protein
MNKILIYGANGFTGRLVIEEALDKGLKPVLSGRNKQEIEKLATEFGLEFKAFSLDNIGQNLDDIAVVIHCAGPFEFTAMQMAKACIEKGVHYIDITGEITVFESLQKLDAAAKAANIMLMPGAGFDVVPTDCLASMLKEKMPNGTDLEMAFTGIGTTVSRGTATTAIQNLGSKNLIRENGKLKEVPSGKFFKWIDFGSVKHHCVSISWGDVSTAYFSTGIPNIKVYMGLKASVRKWMLFGNWISPILKMKAVKNYLIKQLKKRPEGPNAEQRINGYCLIWGELSNKNSERITMHLKTREGYSFTALSSVLIASKIISGNFKAGYQTPSTAYGSALVLEVGGTEIL